MTRLVVALGGNALLRRGEPLEASVQRRNVRRAAESLALLARDHELVITHGNGPQVGLLALQSAAYSSVRPYPLDILGAESEGMIGYLIENDLRNALPGHEVATLLTQVIVDRHDPAFRRPTKPIGPLYPEAEARRLALERGWTVGHDGTQWRRLVPSPDPVEIVQLRPIRILCSAGVTVICGGGGGVPVVRDERGHLDGVEAVIDKDLLAALLASSVAADGLVMLTDVDAVYEGWGGPEPRPIREATPRELRAGCFAPGSMGPKVEAACRFVERGGTFAAIGALADAPAILKGRAGTTVRRAVGQ
ncbi:MAG TPA: carbamate kinase [Chloroflexota bacterium]|nr:carbamate kinase [Chloroflexota bacterium]